MEKRDAAHQTIRQVARAFQDCASIRAVVLGGSRATGSATERSDIDIGLYYDRNEADFAQYNAIAARLDDRRRDDLICTEGGWGRWVNCGGWLTVNGHAVDIILRDWQRVQTAVEETGRGICTCHYQPGHPHAFLNVMYRGELACCKVLHARDEAFFREKRQAESYPPALKRQLVETFLFEADFSCALAEKCVASGAPGSLAAHMFRAVSAMHQVLFALNETWLLNEKKAALRAESLPAVPAGYAGKVNSVFTAADPITAVTRLRALCGEVSALAAQGMAT